MLTINKRYHITKTKQNELDSLAHSQNAWLPLSEKRFSLLNSIIYKYDKYSDFIATNIWAYMGAEAKIYFHGDGVAIRMLDDYTNEPYYTLISKRSTKALLDAIVEHNTNKSKYIQLRHVPKETLKYLKKDTRLQRYEEDRDNHDYTYSVSRLINFNTIKLRSRRKQLTKIKNKLSNLKIIYDLQNNQDLINDVVELYDRWIDQTKQVGWKKDYDALKRILKQKTVPQIIVCAYDSDKIIGFTVNEIIGHGYYLGFSGKADRKYPNLSILLEHETAKIMKQKFGCKYLNMQQDLGIEGLRNYKLSLSPDRFIEKYKITIANQKLKH